MAGGTPGHWAVELTDAGPNAWFALSEPVELGRLRWFVDKLLKYHLSIQLIGAFLLSAALALSLVCLRARRAISWATRL